MSRRFHSTCLGFVLTALLTGSAAAAHPAAEAEFRDAVNGVEQLTRDLHQNVALYQGHLQRAMEIYGRGFDDPDYHQKLPGFAQDIRTGDSAQTETIKRGVFACILMTSGVRLDPDPLHDWAEVEKSLELYQLTLDKANTMGAESNIRDTTNPDTVSSESAQKLRSQLQSAARRAEQERNAAVSLRPTKLDRGQTFAGQATEGMNLRFTLLGVEFGRELGNVNALTQLTYAGHTAAIHLFLLTVLNAAEQKTRTDTWISSRTLQIYSNAADSGRYGHVITAQDHGDYKVAGARIADVAPTVHDWIWKSAGAPHAALSDLDNAVRRVQESQRSIDAAMAAFQQLALNAVRENDEALIAASTNHQKVQLPEQDLKFSYPEVRAKLYAVRALSAGDPRFVAAIDAVKAARIQAETSVNEGSKWFGYFNAIATHTAPELPWKNIQKLATEFMDVADDVRHAGEHANQSLPRALGTDQTAVTVHVSFIIEQTNRGPGAANQKTLLMSEHILQDVHWVVKGIPRREYTTEIIEISPIQAFIESKACQVPHISRALAGFDKCFRVSPKRKIPRSDLPLSASARKQCS